MDEIKVGSETQAYCTSCKTMREHVVVAMVGARPAKVECAECHKQHLFRAGPPGTKTAKAEGAAKATARKRATTTRATTRAAKTIDLAAETAGREARSYDPRSAYAVGDVVRHPSFGVGLVTALPGSQKMEIYFASGSKLLAHDRAAAPGLARPARADEEAWRHVVTDAPPERR